MGIKDKITDMVKDHAEEIGQKSTDQILSAFKKTFEDMSQMISDTQDNQIELNNKITQIQKDIQEIKLKLK
jgi:hypothetical protein